MDVPLETWLSWFLFIYIMFRKLHQGDPNLFSFLGDLSYETPSHPTCAEDAIFLVLLVHWMGVGGDEGYQVLEYFAGVARIAALAKAVGYTAFAYDRDFGKSSKRRSKRSPMDLNSSAGLVLLGSNMLLFSARPQSQK
jgi:hypothetical protein